MVKLIVSGVLGRMGRRIARLSLEDSGIELSGGIEVSGHEGIGKDLGVLLGLEEKGIRVSDNLEKIISRGDVIVDFSGPEVTLNHLRLAAKEKKGMVIGTTGFTEEEKKIIARHSGEIPVVYAPNMSVGMNLLFKLTEEAAGVVGGEYDLEIVEAHHRHKKDSPSGTALQLAAILARVTGRKLEEVATFGRKGLTGLRPQESIGIHAVRGGDIVGEHTVIMAGEGERIELVHKASSRDAFARGAIKAVKFVADKPPGLYDMGDVLGMKK